jgi:hypothetical protein
MAMHEDDEETNRNLASQSTAAAHPTIAKSPFLRLKYYSQQYCLAIRFFGIWLSMTTIPLAVDSSCCAFQRTDTKLLVLPPST